MGIERTLSIIKPDATARNVAGKIIARIEEEAIEALDRLDRARNSALENHAAR